MLFQHAARCLGRRFHLGGEDDSGTTRDRYTKAYPQKPFFALIDRQTRQKQLPEGWVVFPWEGDAEGSAEDNVRRMIQYIGEDPARGGLVETPRRVVAAWDAWFSGYRTEPASVLKTFEDGAAGYDEMILVKDIPFYSHCEHHVAPFFGTATVAYIPQGRIVGLSKLSRLLDVFARRLQVQERMTNQYADALQEALNPLGVGVILRARHLCMESRGVRQQGHHTVTSALRGALKNNPETRSEFMQLAR